MVVEESSTFHVRTPATSEYGKGWADGWKGVAGRKTSSIFSRKVLQQPSWPRLAWPVSFFHPDGQNETRRDEDGTGRDEGHHTFRRQIAVTFSRKFAVIFLPFILLLSLSVHPGFYFPSFGLHLRPYVYICMYIYVCVCACVSLSVGAWWGRSEFYL